jgi:hypothetical protein
MGNKDNKNRKKKRRFSCNQFTKVCNNKHDDDIIEDDNNNNDDEEVLESDDAEDDCNQLKESLRSSKLNATLIDNVNNYDEDNFFFIMNFKILKEVLQSLPFSCPMGCTGSSIVFNHCPEGRLGFVSKLNMSYSTCN